MVFQIDGPSDVSQGFTEFSNFRKSLGEYVWADRLEDFDYDKWIGKYADALHYALSEVNYGERQ
jgi:hypothetical protein